MAKKKKKGDSKTPPKKVVAKVTPKKVVTKKVAAKPTVKAKPVLSAAVTSVKSMLKEYKEYSCRAIITEQVRQEIVVKFVTIVNFVTTSNEIAVIDELFKFFIEEKNGLMSEEVALCGISKLGAHSMIKVEALYAALRISVNNIGRPPAKKTKLNLELVREKLGETFVAYLASKK